MQNAGDGNANSYNVLVRPTSKQRYPHHYHHPPTANHQPPTTNRQPPTTHQPPTATKTPFRSSPP
ncbi:hypothetical protein HETIRDRAFT_411230 [Heterobasidion irregulare TC 32-1]|uniref:Uncharacterized protein n=1 Tax=Heterobasidion irregulare (strain TC 32-1) TaxID=747525 RepID=W4JX45_HETIT|nr:uncharacterized protein HETIRDRAFT_411230 [Heterobasidion irregulare TC 32-1]ETW78029.1 hypothetical protein HETIRDRAFT_411230 [Heterobasidion irregulare TC 32-1]